MRIIDLRSDTVTQPTEEMREAMARAEVGDDVYREDPTVRQLEAYAAELLGKEAALFVSSGTMGNLVSLLSHTRPGDEVILEENSHIYYYEVGGLAMVAGLTPRLITSRNGLFSLNQLQEALRPENIHFPATSLVCLENTHNRAGGKVLPQGEVLEVAKLARERGLKLHLDGARLFNAACASHKSARVLAEPFDSVMFCLSKGLAAPVGSMVVGSLEFIERARKFRKMLGGGLRQAGVLAAAGLYALQFMTDRLKDDHARATWLSQGLGAIEGLQIISPPETNMVMVEVNTPSFDVVQLLQAWRDQGILASSVSVSRIRLVTHYQITDGDIETVIAITKDFAKGIS